MATGALGQGVSKRTCVNTSQCFDEKSADRAIKSKGKINQSQLDEFHKQKIFKMIT